MYPGNRCRWARKQAPKAGPGATEQLGTAVEDWQLATYSQVTRRSLAAVDESLLNYDLLETLVVHIVQAQAAHGPAAMLQASTNQSPVFDAMHHLTIRLQADLLAALPVVKAPETEHTKVLCSDRAPCTIMLWSC